MHRTFHRDALTWLAYFSLAFYAFFLNVLGPITPFLKEDLNLSYTVSSLHFTAFAVGILLIGFGGHVVIQHLGRLTSLWIGMLGISLGMLLLLTGKSAVVTIGASFLMGLIGSLILAIVPAALSDQHGESRAVALSEANMISSLLSTAAPLMIGWFASSAGSWQLPLGIMACTPLLLYMILGKSAARANPASAGDPSASKQPLSPLFWVYWVALMLGVAVEFCMVFWSADFLENVLDLGRANAAQAVSLFLAAMIIGRLLGSRLVGRFSARPVIMISIVIASLGFLLFWRTGNVPLGLSGLFLTGLGVANFYPLLLSQAIGAAEGNTVQAGARATLASGTAILALPLVLGRLADAVGIRSAYGVVALLLLSVFLISQIAAKVATSQRSAPALE